MYQQNPKYQFSQKDIDPSIAQNIASGAAVGSTAGPYGALIGGGLAAITSAWDEVERRNRLPALTSANIVQGMKQDLGSRSIDPTITQRYAESLAPVNIKAKILAGTGGGWQFGENWDDYKFKQQMRQENPWAALQAQSQRGQV